jgi:hypothetical protein
MALKAVLGLLPEADLVRLTSAAFSNLLGTAHNPALGWALHVVIGSAWGVVYALVWDRLPGRSPGARGVAFAIWPWLVMMVVLMPIAGAGWFALTLGWLSPLWMLLLQLVFGVVLGVAYQGLEFERARADATASRRTGAGRAG